MNWNISFKLQPGEVMLEEHADEKKFGLQAMYTPILTNKRALFKFNSLNTSLVQSFGYDEITHAQPAMRLLVKYLKLTARGREFFLNVGDPEGLAGRILECREKYIRASDAPPAVQKMHSLAELLSMLEALRDYGLLTAEEFEEKRKAITR